MGPLFDDPTRCPCGSTTSTATSRWTDDRQSQLCGACHNVIVDIDGDGLSPVEGRRAGARRRCRQ